MQIICGNLGVRATQTKMSRATFAIGEMYIHFLYTNIQNTTQYQHL